MLFIGDPTLPEVQRRHEGYREALAAHGIAASDELVLPVPFATDLARPHIERRIAERKSPFDGVFACSDLLAMTSIKALRAAGRVVPQALPVVGYDDVELARHLHPSLTTVRQSIDEAGRAMVDALEGIVVGETVASVQLPTELVVRETSRRL